MASAARIRGVVSDPISIDIFPEYVDGPESPVNTQGKHASWSPGTKTRQMVAWDHLPSSLPPPPSSPPPPLLPSSPPPLP